MDLVLSNATVLTLDDAGTVLPACDVVVRDGVIESLDPHTASANPAPANTARRVIDASDLRGGQCHIDRILILRKGDVGYAQ